VTVFSDRVQIGRKEKMRLLFAREQIKAELLLASGKRVQRRVEVRTSPITGRTARITFSRGEEREPVTEQLPTPPPFAEDRSSCPFCSENLNSSTPKFIQELYPEGRIRRNNAGLFPNLFPYGKYSAVSIFDDNHFVEIGTASPATYRDSLLNCQEYLLRVKEYDPEARYLAMTQNHLPSAGGSLLHPHLQVQADTIPANHQRFLPTLATAYSKDNGSLLFSDYLAEEMEMQERMLGTTGEWFWLTSFAPEGFYEIWSILPGVTSLQEVTESHWADLASGIISCQRFYRSLGRNGYNLAILFDAGCQSLEVRVVLTVRSNYAPWVRSDFTGFELGLGDMATFDSPEDIACKGRHYWT